MHHLTLHASLTIPIIAAIVGAILAFGFNGRVQRKALRNKIKTDHYEKLVTRHSELNLAIVTLNATIQGIDGTLSVIRYKDQSRGIPGKTKASVDADIRSYWSDHVNKAAKDVSNISEAFSGLHRLIETSYYLYPQLKDVFILLLREYEEIMKLINQYSTDLWSVDPFTLIPVADLKRYKEQRVFPKMQEQLIHLLMYSEDFMFLAQKSLLRGVFWIRQKPRKPLEKGLKYLTRKGWKTIK